MWVATSCGNRSQDRWGTELDLGGSQSLDDHHRGSTVRAEPEIARGMIRGWFGLGWRGYGAECWGAKRQERGAPPVGEEAEVANAAEALG